MKALGTARGFRLVLAGALAVVLLRAGMVGLVLPPLHGGSPGAAAPAHEAHVALEDQDHRQLRGSFCFSSSFLSFSI